jgi:hypothetical protein
MYPLLFPTTNKKSLTSDWALYVIPTQEETPALQRQERGDPGEIKAKGKPTTSSLHSTG